MTTQSTPLLKQDFPFEIRANKTQLIRLQDTQQWPKTVEFNQTWHDSIDSNGKLMPGFMTAAYSNRVAANNVYESLRKYNIAVTRNWTNEHVLTRPNITGVFTSEEAFQRAKVTKTLVVQSFCKSKAFFFSDQHCFNYNGIDQDCLVPSTLVFPMSVVSRDGLEDGVIDTIEKYIFVFKQDSQQLSTIEEVLDHVKREENVDDQFAEPVFAMGETYESYMTDEKSVKAEMSIVSIEKDVTRKTITIGFERKDGDLQVLATLNNNDSLISPEFFEFMVKQFVQTFELAGVKVTDYERQDAPDYTDLSEESDHRFHFQGNKPLN